MGAGLTATKEKKAISRRDDEGAQKQATLRALTDCCGETEGCRDFSADWFIPPQPHA
jgi:hypothetical protein